MEILISVVLHKKASYKLAIINEIQNKSLF